MGDPRNEFFTTSVDRDANRELARRISARVVEALRPDEVLYTEYAFDTLLDLAARGEVAQPGSGAKFGFGGVELLLMVVVPLVTSALTAAFVGARAAGVYGIEQPPAAQPLVSQAQVEALLRRSRLRVGRDSVAGLHTLVNQIVADELARAGGDHQPGPGGRCCGYDCAALRERFATAFSPDELRDLCFDLSEPHDDVILEGVPLSSNARSLLEHFGRRGRICELVALARSRRRHLDWDSLTPPM
ncbi:MAG: hypothetical protein HGA45_31465 [Chloroflexales bacterium]|nr:hypothetical protein [Chloroflexales bacterium]